MEPTPRGIVNSEAVTDIFGYWPTFHDAEVHSLRLERGNTRPSLQAEIHAFEITREVTSDGFFRLEHHTLVRLHFEGIDDVELAGFNQQNVLFELTLNDISDRQLELLKWEVEFSSSFGVEGRFMCEGIAVLSAVAFDPNSQAPALGGAQSPPKRRAP